jgi:multimeric flavodoxin WrbA
MGKRIFAIIGSGKSVERSSTAATADVLAEKIYDYYPYADIEIATLGDYNLTFCKGCMKCRNTGCCCIEDDLDKIVEKIREADLVILGSPSQISHVSGLYKNFLDRLNIFMHTFEFIGKPFVSVVSAGGSGEKEVLKYINHTATLLGMINVGSLVKFSNLPVEESDADIIARNISDIFWGTTRLEPSYKNIYYFRWMRNFIKRHPSSMQYEYRVWRERGWFDSTYRNELYRVQMQDAFGMNLICLK